MWYLSTFYALLWPAETVLPHCAARELFFHQNLARKHSWVWDPCPKLRLLLVFLYANSRFADVCWNLSTANYEGHLYFSISLILAVKKSRTADLNGSTEPSFAREPNPPSFLELFPILPSRHQQQQQQQQHQQQQHDLIDILGQN